MTDFERTDVVRVTAAIARVEPSSAASRRALDRTRQALRDLEGPEDARVIRTLDDLGGVATDDDATHQAILKVRRTLLAGQERSRRRTTRLLTAVGVAASIALLLVILHAPPGSLNVSSAGLTGLMRDLWVGLAPLKEILHILAP